MTTDEELKDAREWLKFHTEFYGEPVDRVKQIGGVVFDGEELLEYVTAYHRHRLETAWVSVKERLPEKEGFYIIYAESADANSPLIKQVWFNSKRFEIVEIWEDALTHWQPLPEPPKEMK